MLEDGLVQANEAKDEEIKSSRILQEKSMQADFIIKNKDEEIKALNWKLMAAENAIKVKDEEIKLLKGKPAEGNNMIKVKDEEIKKLKEELAKSKSALQGNRAENTNKKQIFSMLGGQMMHPIENEEKDKVQRPKSLTGWNHRPFKQPNENEATWTCEKCTLVNENGSNVCLACGNEKPGWACERCKLINNQNREECDFCSWKRKMENEKTASREAERDMVLSYEKDGYSNGYYAVSREWINNWINYTKGGQRPGRLTTSLFYDSEGRIKQGLKNSRDYRMINKRQWEYLNSAYGGEPPLICSSNNIYSSENAEEHFERPLSSRIGGGIKENWNNSGKNSIASWRGFKNSYGS